MALLTNLAKVIHRTVTIGSNHGSNLIRHGLATGSKSSVVLSVPDPPKRPVNAYMLFSKQKRAELQSSNKEVPFRELSKQIALVWRELRPEQKKVYEDTYKKTAESFRVEEQKWWHSLTPLQQAAYNDAKSKKKEKKEKRRLKSELKQLGKPQRPVSGFSFFVAARKNDRKDMDVKDYIKYLATTWNNMQDAEKMPYQQVSARDKERYDKEMAEWEKKMVQMGNVDLVRKSSQEVSSTGKSGRRAGKPASEE